MKARFSRNILGALLLLVATGCSVIQPILHQQWFGVYDTRTVSARESVAYAAAHGSLEGMGYAYESGSPAAHRLVMVTRIQPGSTAQNLRQRHAILTFRAVGSEGTDVSIGFWESSEEVGPSRESSVEAGKMIRGGELYEAFWSRLEAALPEDAPAP